MTINNYKKNFTPQLWAFLKQHNCVEQYVKNATNQTIGGSLSVNKDVIISQFDAAFRFSKVPHSSLWNEINKEWDDEKQSCTTEVSVEVHPRKCSYYKYSLISASILFVLSVIGINVSACENTHLGQTVNMLSTAIAFACMCVIMIACLHSMASPQED